MTEGYPPLPSDGVPCVIDDGPLPAEYPCNCTDHRVTSPHTDIAAFRAATVVKVQTAGNP